MKIKDKKTIRGSFCFPPVIGECAFIQKATGFLRTTPVVRCLSDQMGTYLETENTVYLIDTRRAVR